MLVPRCRPIGLFESKAGSSFGSLKSGMCAWLVTALAPLFSWSLLHKILEKMQ
jgi:hypothetical protein